ncbi:glutamyl-tRNA reductase [Halarchaeum rubridurum]|uniref:Glutamyl-tRNA reductase n=1 Tax=Halarchaeum rubridurum TaxID=489911 RepID=A0A830FWX5_9EURY|nr:glutamyl-tRNA reductase [Halarchaeum rubridurum]MBP1953870.1 glutamyl-tRNA reductase [Halarchaeum rubridurum]GGM55486.1 glutamyl-tRNA reductase [Halarchaeum rubridurum]
MNRNTSVVSGVRVAHPEATVEDIEDARADSTAVLLDALGAQGGVEEAYALQTCNRVEAYVVTDDPEAGRRALDAVGLGDHPAAVATGHEESLRHLMRVAAGLESLVVGEDQILGQVRRAYEAAVDSGDIGPVLEEGVTKAIHVGERARNETAINEGVVSLGSAAVHLADAELDLDDASALVVGAGEMGSLAAKAFDAAGVADVVVANRTPEHAEWVLADLDAPGRAVDLDALPRALSDADVVVAATGSDEPVVTPAVADDAGETFYVDLGQPRDVAPAVAADDEAAVHDLDDLEDVTARTRERRATAAIAVESIVEEELDRLLSQYKRKRADAVIAQMYESAERTKDREVATALSRLDAASDGGIGDAEREVVESLADALVSQLLAAPTRSLREAAGEDDWETIATAIRLFDPDVEGADPPFGDGADAPRFAAVESETD